ncbi:MAG: hypothetical protein ACRC5C_01010, partial [Bacilli bacterium]
VVLGRLRQATALSYGAGVSLLVAVRLWGLTSLPVPWESPSPASVSLDGNRVHTTIFHLWVVKKLPFHDAVL